MKVLLATSGGAGRCTLAALRSLALAGFDVTVGGDHPRGEAFRSRFCRSRIRYPSAKDDVAGFQTALLEHLQNEKFDVLLPLSDYTQLAICEIREQVESLTRLALSANASIARAQDKLATLELARELGIGIPETHAPASRTELEEISAEINYPCVLKPRSGAGARETYIVESREMLLRCHAQLPLRNDRVYDYRPLVQDYIPGRVHDVGALCCNGEARALLTQVRLRMHPAAAGIGIDNLTTRDPELQELATRLLDRLDWHGPAQVEFKRDERDGEPKLMEINPRFWGTLDLAVRAGIDFPTLAVRLALDGDVEPCFDYRAGLRCRWLDDSNPSSIFDVLRPGRNEVTDFRWFDPGPQLYRWRGWLERRRRG